MKQGWELDTLGNVCTFQRGLTYSKKDEVDISENIVLRATNVSLINNRLDFSELKYIDESILVSESKKVKKGSLLICTASGSKSHLGKVAYIDNDYGYAFGGFMGQLIPSEKIYPRYFFYRMISEDYKKFIEKLSDGVNINNLKYYDLKSFQIPIPPLDEQKRIVTKLDKSFEAIDKARANLEKNLNNAKDLFQSQLNQIFSQKGNGSIETTIGEQITLQRGFDITKKEQRPGIVPVVSSGGIKSFHDTSMVNAPGVVMGRKGTIGKVFYLENDFWPHDTTLWVKEFNENEPKLVYYFFKNLDVKGLDTGTANPALNRNHVHPLQVDWPILEKQNTIIKQLDELDARTASLKSHYQQELDALDELKKSILQKAFRGEL